MSNIQSRNLRSENSILSNALEIIFECLYSFFAEPLTSLHEGSEESGDMGSQNYFFDQRPSMVSFPSAFPPFEQPPLPKPPKGNYDFD